MEGHPPADPAADIMNDPRYATNTEDGGGEPDTCRICRGEATEKEPLFYPCKCSGSIKYVHQNCLMDWLSHSQKKHCELCKTPFRFTKLYSPKMPETLPAEVFLRQFAIHGMKNVVVWLRACLVVTVWLVFLPYIIRQFWRVLFWFSDGFWPTAKHNMISTTGDATALQAIKKATELQLAYLAANETSPATPFSPTQTTPAGFVHVVNKFTDFMASSNASGTDPLAAGFLQAMSYMLGFQSPTIPAAASNAANLSQLLTEPSGSPLGSSLLSDVSFLKNLTRSAEFNQLVITVAEGYVISILVVVCFILVFLIREWVVQQQPGINMGAGFNADPPAVGQLWNQPNLPENLRQPQPEGRPDVVPRAGPNVRDQNPLDVEQRPIARPRRRIGNLPRENQANQEINTIRPSFREYDPTLHVDLPDLPQYAETRQRQWAALNARQIAESHRSSDDSPQNTEEFMSIWRRADGDLEEILRIIERENLTDQMRYWVNAIQQRLSMPPPTIDSQRTPAVTQRRLAHRNASFRDLQLGSERARSPAIGQDLGTENSWNSNFGEASSSQSGRSRSPLAQNGSDERYRAQIEELRSNTSSSSWVDLQESAFNRDAHPGNENIIGDNAEEESTGHENGKGKGKAKEGSNEPLYDPDSGVLPALDWSSPPSTETSKSIAISDAKPRESSSLLEKNTWNFSNLSAIENESGAEENQADGDTESGVKSANANLTDNLEPQDAAESITEPTIATSDLHTSSQVSENAPAIESSPRDDGIPNSSESTLNLPEIEGPLEIQGQDGVVRNYANWEEAFAANPVEPADSDVAVEDPATEAPQANPFDPDTPLPEPREPVVLPANEPQGFLGRVADWLWGAVGDNAPAGEQGANDERVVEDLAAEAPFVPVAQPNPDNIGNNLPPQQDREVVEAAIAAGIDPNDPDAVDDAEDFEGIMELIGMRGPIFGLIQNALFSAFLLALTVAFGVWIPYSIGRITVLLVANPGPALKLPLRLVYGCAAFLQDMALAALGVVSYCLVLPLRLWALYSGNPGSALASQSIMFSSEALRISNAATDRILDGTVSFIINVADSDMFTFSAASHEALLSIKSTISSAMMAIGSAISFLYAGDYNFTLEGLRAPALEILRTGSVALSELLQLLSRPNLWVISFEVVPRSVPLDPQLSIWDGVDRFWATLIGYITLTTLGALYVHKGSPFSTSQAGQEWEATLLDVLNQAGGVMKVILIISIEMLVFPLYCGLLLDAALLPLFDNATITSRVLFTLNSPLTSIFVHWFVGTCYMFHFALFVSMCRKIMRKGVLCKYLYLFASPVFANSARLHP